MTTMQHTLFRLGTIAFAACIALDAQAQSPERFDGIAPNPAQPGSVFFGASGSGFDYAANALVGELQVFVPTEPAPADGQYRLPVRVKLLGRDGQPLKSGATVTIETTGGRVLLPGARTDELGPGRLDADRATPGVQLRVENGEAEFFILAPVQAQDVRIRLTAGAAVVQDTISFVPALRDWMGIGLVEGIIHLRGKSADAITPVRLNDGFEDELRAFEREFNSGKGRVAGRTAFFVTGTIKGEVLLTAAYDSDKDTRARLLQDIRPEELYPVYGDASIKGYAARSASKLYVRIDKDKHYLLWGDFATGDGFSQIEGGGNVASVTQRDLGQTNRSITGIRGHYEDKAVVANAWAAHDTLTQVVDEFAANGTSFLYGLSRRDAVQNSEKIEIITRDRNNPSRILSVKPLLRLVDYTFEPFYGRILLASPLASLDPQGNPQSLRITYEIDGGGDAFLVAGADAQIKLGDRIEVGGSVMIDKNPGIPSAGIRQLKQLASVNAGVVLLQNDSASAKLVAEAAQTESVTSADDVTGRAARVELVAGANDGGWTAKVHAARSGANFNNPAASYNAGKGEAGVQGGLKLNERWALRGEYVHSEQRDVPAGEPIPRRDGAFLGVDWQTTDALTLTLGARRVSEVGNLQSAYPPTSNSLYGGTGLTPGSGGLFGSGAGINTTTGAPVGGVGVGAGSGFDSTTLFLGARFKATDRLTLQAEGEQTVSGDERKRGVLGADYLLAERTRLVARYEAQSAGTSAYNGLAEGRANQAAFGIVTSYLPGSEVYGEYRLRDAIAGRESQLASGVRNIYELNEHWRLSVGAEHLHVLDGGGQTGTAATAGADYTSELWRAAGRLELRQLGDNVTTDTTDERSRSRLATLLVATKIDRDWTGLARVFHIASDALAIGGDQVQNRLQFGLAYRPVDTSRFDALAKVELKHERNGELPSPESRKVVVGAVIGNWHPSRPWWLSLRLAAKGVAEVIEGQALPRFGAVLAGARATWDFTERWDVSVMGNVLQGVRGDRSRQSAYGAEIGYSLATNLWASAGYNITGYRADRDFGAANDYTSKGAYLRLRFKFDETLFAAGDKETNRSLDR
jgi:hypothetical protein